MTFREGMIKAATTRAQLFSNVFSHGVYQERMYCIHFLLDASRHAIASAFFMLYTPQQRRQRLLVRY